MLKKVKCNVCNYKFFVEKEKIQIVCKKEYIALMEKVEKYNAIDCPKCGCQKILWPRLMEIKK